MRKVIQIACNPESQSHFPELFALCNDGSIWVECNGEKWKQILDVPQPKKRPDPLSDKAKSYGTVKP